MAHRVVRFGAEHGADLVDTFEHADHHLLVELRALGEEGATTEPVDREHVGTALGRGGDDLRRVHLHEVRGVERGAEPGDRRGREPERSASARVAERHRGVVEDRRELRAQLGPPELERRCEVGLHQHRDLGVVQLESRRRLLGRDDGALHDDDRLGEERRQSLAGGVVDDDDLRDPPAVAQQHERDVRQWSLMVEPAGDADALAGVTRQVDREDPVRGSDVWHSTPLLATTPWSCGREGSPAVPPHFAPSPRCVGSWPRCSLARECRSRVPEATFPATGGSLVLGCSRYSVPSSPFS